MQAPTQKDSRNPLQGIVHQDVMQFPTAEASQEYLQEIVHQDQVEDGKSALDRVLLVFQQRWIADTAEVKVWEKSRRIGASWAEASHSALLAAMSREAGGTNTYYISYNKDMTRQFIGDVAFFAKLYGLVCSEVQEEVLEDEGKATIFRVVFASGFEVVGLPSKASALRSKQGRVIIDEAAFIEDLDEILKAAMALLIWGGQVLILSTHNGEDNRFNEIVQDIRGGRLDWSLHRTTLADAVREGFYRRVCQVKGKEWTQEAEAAWFDHHMAGPGAEEELACIPSRTGGSWLNRALVESCMHPDIPVIRWNPPAADFVDWPTDRAYREVRDWFRAELDPVLAAMPASLPSWMGEDFARDGDLTALWPLQDSPSLVLQTPFILELRNAPFRTQEQVLGSILSKLPRFSGVALDARGNGQALAEYMRQDFGQDLADEVMFSQSWYREHMPKLKARLEDRTVTLPRDEGVLEDLRLVRMTKGVASIPDGRTGGKDAQRHGDTAIALALAIYASATMNGGTEFSVSTALPRQSGRGSDLMRGW